MVRVEATGICGSDLHIYHGRVAIEPGFVIGHEYVGTVVAAGDAVSEVAVGDRVLGTYGTACGGCFHCRRAEYHQCDSGRVFGHGATLGSLQGAQAELLLVPNANLTLRRVPEGLSDEVALFAGDVAGTAYHAICGDAAKPDPLEPGAAVAVLGLGPVGLCAVQVARASGASLVVAVDSVEERLRTAEALGAVAVHLTEDDPRGRVKELTGGAGRGPRGRRGRPSRGARPRLPPGPQGGHRLGHRRLRRARRGPHGRRLDQGARLAHRPGQRDRPPRPGAGDAVGRACSTRAPLVTHRMSLDEAPEAYAIYDRREALKIVLRPVAPSRYGVLAVASNGKASWTCVRATAMNERGLRRAAVQGGQLRLDQGMKSRSPPFR